MFKAVIFDFDGTLVDSEWAYALADIEFVKAIGGDVSNIDHAEFVGGGVRYFVEYYMSKYEITDRSAEELIQLNDKIFLDIADNEITVFPKMLSLIKDLHKRGFPMAIASGSSQWILDTISEKTGVDRYIDKIYSSELVEYDKPEPDVYLHAAKKLGVKPEECLVFEDSATGFRSAIRAGMKCIWFDSLGNKNKDLEAKAFKYYPDGQESFDFKDIVNLLK
ncbi:HAD family phosphatase [Thiospirochaeta perfilievii]|uniref:HAD family phosphatase n=1 Tax=Thiospirochaeta perfilievii TaxID=252967 RepID=A0A5C1QFN5_9SPIO|nr:HAD family phosphatase [Thiospirochaeta perfilievii]QEN05406.1 HAD family phosphatase [Thiospirochaeta perfilievii]